MIIHIIQDSIRRAKLISIYSLVRIMSLSIGLICLGIFASILLVELSYEKQNPNADRIFRLIMNDHEQGKQVGYHAGAAIDLFKDNFPQIEKIVRVLIFDHTIKVENNDPINSKVVIADPGFFNLFNLRVINDNGDELLKRPDLIFISEKEANRLFPNDNPLGKIILLNNKKEYSIGGIIQNIQSQTHLQLDYLISTESRKTAIYLTDFNYKATGFYILLKSKNLKKQTEEAFTDFVCQYFKVDKSLISFELQNLKDIYLHSGNIQQHSYLKSGNLQLILFIPWITALILTVVIGNYMLLDIGNIIASIFRFGIFRTYGESRKILFLKQYFQNLIYFIIAGILSVILIIYLGQKFTGSVLIGNSNPFLHSAESVAILLAAVIILPVIPSAYALKLAGSISIPDALKYNKSKVVEIKVVGNKYSINLRKIMMGFQLFAGICLITSTLVASKQIKFLSSMNLGFNRKNVIVIKNDKKGMLNPKQRQTLLKQWQENSTTFSHFASSSNMPLTSTSNITQVRLLNQPTEKEIQVGYVGVDYHFFKTIGARISNGRDFDEALASDTIESVIINSTLAKSLGEDILGKKLIGFWEEKVKTVVGIVEDIYFNNPNKLPEPTAFILNDLGFEEHLYFRTNTDYYANALNSIQDYWKKIDPMVPFDFQFMDDVYQSSCTKEINIRYILTISSIICIVLTLIGIISVSYLVSTSRIKEMSVRRALGASPLDIFRIYITEFYQPFIFSILLAVPFTYITLSDWLTRYGNRINISLDNFFYTILLLAILLITICLVTTIKTSNKSIADVLRYE